MCIINYTATPEKNAAEKALARAILASFNHMLIIEADVTIPLWTDSLREMLNFAITQEIVTGKEVLTEINMILRRIGRMSFYQHIHAKVPSDHVQSPQALAYALANGEFSPEEKQMIEYDHGEIERTFIQEYNYCDLKQGVLNSLLKKTELPTPQQAFIWEGCN